MKTSRNQTKPEMNELLHLLRLPLDPVPAGYKTIEAWAAECGKTRADMNAHLIRLLAAEKVERRKFRVGVGLDTARRKWHYRVK